MGKESFLLYKSFYEPIKSLSLEDKGTLFDAIYNYQLSGVEPPNTSLVYMAFLFFKNQFCLDEIKYEETCSSNKTNAKRRWNAKHASASERMQPYAKHADNDTEKDNEKEKEKDNVTVNDKEVLHPLQIFVKTLHEVSKIKTQLTVEDCEALIKSHGEELTKEILLAMENTKGVANKYTSVFLTVNSWAHRRKSSIRISDPGAVDIKRPYKPITPDQL